MLYLILCATAFALVTIGLISTRKRAVATEGTPAAETVPTIQTKSQSNQDSYSDAQDVSDMSKLLDLVVEAAGCVPPNAYGDDKPRRFDLLETHIKGAIGDGDVSGAVEACDARWIELLEKAHELRRTHNANLNGIETLRIIQETMKGTREVFESLGVPWVAIVLVYVPLLPPIRQ